LTGRSGVAGNEVPNMLRNGSAFDVASSLIFEGVIFRDVIRPMLKRVEGDNADWVAVLPGRHVGDDAFQIGLLDISFPVAVAKSSEIIEHYVDRLSAPFGTIDGVQLWAIGNSQHNRNRGI
jgi:hypothetical protein